MEIAIWNIELVFNDLTRNRDDQYLADFAGFFYLKRLATLIEGLEKVDRPVSDRLAKT